MPVVCLLGQKWCHWEEWRWSCDISQSHDSKGCKYLLQKYCHPSLMTIPTIQMIVEYIGILQAPGIMISWPFCGYTPALITVFRCSNACICLDMQLLWHKQPSTEPWYQWQWHLPYSITDLSMSQNRKCALKWRQAHIIFTYTNKCRQLIFSRGLRAYVYYVRIQSLRHAYSALNFLATKMVLHPCIRSIGSWHFEMNSMSWFDPNFRKISWCEQNGQKLEKLMKFSWGHHSFWWTLPGIYVYD